MYGIDAKLLPLLYSRGGVLEFQVRSIGAAENFDPPGSAVWQQPLAVGILLETVLLEQFCSLIRRVLVPPQAKGLVLGSLIFRNYIAAVLGIGNHSRRCIRIIGFEGFTVAQIQGEFFQPLLHRGNIFCRIGTERRNMHRAQRAGAVNGLAHILGDIDRQ